LKLYCSKHINVLDTSDEKNTISYEGRALKRMFLKLR